MPIIDSRYTRSSHTPYVMMYRFREEKRCVWCMCCKVFQIIQRYAKHKWEFWVTGNGSVPKWRSPNYKKKLKNASVPLLRFHLYPTRCSPKVERTIFKITMKLGFWEFSYSESISLPLLDVGLRHFEQVFWIKKYLKLSDSVSACSAARTSKKKNWKKTKPNT